VHLFIHILLKANHVPRKWRGVDILTGQFITSRDKLSSETGISQQSIRTILKRMQDTNELTIKSTSKYTMLTVCNWETYQNDAGAINQPINKRSTSELTNNQPATNQQLTTNKNDKNCKNEKKKTKREQHDAAVFASAIPDRYSIQFAEAWQSFCDHRADMGNAWLTERAIKLLLKTLETLSEGEAIAALNKSVANGWKGVFPEKSKQTYGKPTQVLTTMPTDDEYAASENVGRDENGIPIF
jgi:hypothetical protein